MTHTQECIAAHDKTQAAIDAYKQTWPNYCRSCNAWGYHVHCGGMVPYGSTWVPLPDSSEPCVCIEDGRCPRCGQQTIDQDTGEGPCSACGWTEKDGMPAEAECSCWLNEPERTP